MGRHVVLDLVGSDGMGDVYRALGTELQRPVALKVLRRRCADAMANLRLVREAQAMARLSHASVVEVHDVGPIRSDVCLSLEYVEGATLSRWLGRLGQSRSIAERLRMFIEAGRGLLAAHEAGVVHRDFKPSNVLIGNDGRARAMDSNLALTDEFAPTERRLERAIRRGMSVLPGDRHASMHTILKELEAELYPRHELRIPMAIVRVATMLTATLAAAL